MYTTDDVAPPERFDYWRDAICAAYVRLDADPVGIGSRFDGSIDVQTWNDTLRMSHVAAGGQVVRRPSGADGDDCLLSIQLVGTGRISQEGRTAVLSAGDMALYDSSRSYELVFDSPFHQIVVQFPREQLTGRGIDLASTVARRCAAEAATTAVGTALVRSLFSHAEGLDTLSTRALSEHALDCLATALRPQGAAPPRQGAGLTRAQVLAFAEANLHDPALSIAGIADAFAVSPRTLQRLFDDGEGSLSERIARARLRRATAALADPSRASSSIASIAAVFGYCDASHLARVFRRAHGCSPSEYRAARG